MNFVKLWIIFLVLYFYASSPQAQMYEWTDEKGVKHYSNVVPSESAEEIKTEKETKEDKITNDKRSIIDKSKARQTGRSSRKAPEKAVEAPSEGSAPEDPEKSAERDLFVKMNLNLKRFPISQDDLVNEEKARLSQIINYAEKNSFSREVFIEREKNRLLKAISDLEAAPLNKFGSYDNKRRQVGYYKYRLEELLESPEKYFSYSGD
ncbi:MAG: DUF4124 domain-containing protein [Deltaproteobacteria bacterium]|nr:MAG: DUF4124 domain-containing protein [Deltaproteobacteria bacterium]